MNIKVSRKWAVEVGLVNSDVISVSENSKAKVDVKVTKFDNEDKTNVELKETEW